MRIRGGLGGRHRGHALAAGTADPASVPTSHQALGCARDVPQTKQEKEPQRLVISEKGNTRAATKGLGPKPGPGTQPQAGGSPRGHVGPSGTRANARRRETARPGHGLA